MRWPNLIFFAAALISSGCSNVLVYKPNAPVARAPQRKLRVAVAPFESLASIRTQTQDFLDDDVCIGMFLPGYFSRYEHYFAPSFLADPDAAASAAQRKSSAWGSAPAEADDSVGYKLFSECLAEELRASGMFASVDYKKWNELADPSSDYDLIITARFFYDRRRGTTCFGLGPLGILQEFGLIPIGAMHRELAFEVQALDRQAPGEPVWTKFVDVPDPAGGVTMFMSGQHTKSGKFRKSTPKLLAKAFLEVRDELNRELSSGGSLDRWAAIRAGR